MTTVACSIAMVVAFGAAAIILLLAEVQVWALIIGESVIILYCVWRAW